MNIDIHLWIPPLIVTIGKALILIAASVLFSAFAALCATGRFTDGVTDKSMVYYKVGALIGLSVALSIACAMCLTDLPVLKASVATAGADAVMVAILALCGRWLANP